MLTANPYSDESSRPSSVMSPEPELTLYDYWRSSAAYRVRIALHLKGLAFEQRPVHLVSGGGQHHSEAYRALNPQGLVPALVHDGRVLTQSLAICEYLDEVFPDAPLLPETPVERARVRALALVVACDIHPLNNLRVLQRLKNGFQAGEDAVVDWMNGWMKNGFDAFERLLERDAGNGRYCAGEAPGLADCFLVPQVYNAERYACDLAPYPRIRRVVARCRQLDPFAAAAPESQPDAQPD